MKEQYCILREKALRSDVTILKLLYSFSLQNSTCHMHPVSNSTSQWTLQKESQYTPVKQKHVYKRSEYIYNSSFKHCILTMIERIHYI